jgi:protein-L-isoaspartate(D-aspartate) O-methyltransferase
MVTDQLISRGITDQMVLTAMEQIPRELFISPDHQSLAYSDGPIPIGFGQTISQPYIVAKMCELLELTGQETVLDVGTGSGYQAAILACCVKHVYSIERIPELAKEAAKIINQINLTNGTIITGDGAKGYQPAAPFDAIIAAASTSFIPTAWKMQLTTTGKIVCPLKSNQGEYITRFINSADQSESKLEQFDQVTFIPLISSA